MDSSSQNGTSDPYFEKDFASRDAEVRERLKYQNEYAQAALRNLLLVNGGAILSLVTALGNTALKASKLGLGWAFVWFSAGMISALLAYGAAFYSQLFFYNATQAEAWNAQDYAHGREGERETMAFHRSGNRCLFVGLLTAGLSLTSFIVGSFVALDALLPAVRLL